VPWVVWEESVGGGDHGIFVSRLVNGDHFELFNSGQPVSVTTNDATRPDISFSGHEPYISWHETVGGHDRLFTGHFEGGATAPAFHLDTPGGLQPSTFGNVVDVRAPISSTCTATPFSSDGTNCRGGAVGTPFALLADGAVAEQKLLGFGYEPSDVSTGPVNGTTSTGTVLTGSANPGGAAAAAGFQFGTTTAYGSSTEQFIPLGSSAQAFSAVLSGLPPATTFHYRAFARSDFTTIVGPDATFTTAAAPVPVNERPTSRIVGLKRKIKSRQLKRFHGTAADPDDGVKLVDVAVTRLGRGARASAAACSVLKPSGKLKKVRKVAGKCRPHFLRAKGTTSWSLKLKRRLPKGNYVVYSRATDNAGQRQAGFNRANRRLFKVR
jgi:hypothetical protein